MFHLYHCHVDLANLYQATHSYCGAVEAARPSLWLLRRILPLPSLGVHSVPAGILNGFGSSFSFINKRLKLVYVGYKTVEPSLRISEHRPMESHVTLAHSELLHPDTLEMLEPGTAFCAMLSVEAIQQSWHALLAPPSPAILLGMFAIFHRYPVL
jgi:hypothetical protein